jgi:NADH:ubiquinone oxidoreductase subunit
MEALRRAGLKLYSAMSPSRKLVGMDRALNSYWVIREPSAAGRLEKREVWYAKGGALDTEDVPVLWWSWLSYRRETFVTRLSTCLPLFFDFDTLYPS